jgi:hypothetical protein
MLNRESGPLCGWLSVGWEAGAAGVKEFNAINRGSD